MVADKTGYPAEMLTLEMALEGDLGIDSIKRVEILSSLRDRLPDLPDVETSVLAELTTMGQVVDFMAENVGTAAPTAPGATAPAAPTTLGGSPAPAVDLTELLREVVADKTGYPAEMLTLEMALEGDLGIDSIKRVEILSSLRDRLPDLPDVETSVLAELTTMGQVVDFMAENVGTAAPTAPGAPTPGGPATDRVE